MARKKKQPTEEPQENLDNTDDTFGLPEVDYQPLKRDEPAKAEEPAQPEESIPDEKVVVINEYTPNVPEPPPTPDPATQFRESESVETEPEKENTFEGKRTYEAEHQPYQPPAYTYEEERPSAAPKVIGILLLLLLIGGAAWWYFASYRPKQLAKQEQEQKDILAAQELARKKEDERLAAIKAEEDAKNAAAAEPPKPAIGTIETLGGRSGRYYVVVASSIDGDLIMDYAKKLSAKGVSTKIIPPFGKSSFHRLAVAEGDAYQATQETADGLKGGDYGDKVWVVKY